MAAILEVTYFFFYNEKRNVGMCGKIAECHLSLWPDIIKPPMSPRITSCLLYSTRTSGTLTKAFIRICI